MFRHLTQFCMIFALCLTMASCGKKKNKKKLSNNNSQISPLNFTDGSFPIEEPETEIQPAIKLDQVIIFEVTNTGRGKHQIIFLPAKNGQQETEKWYWRNGSNEQTENLAYRIYPQENKDTTLSFPFELSPALSPELKDIIKKAGGSLFEFDGDNKVFISCGKVNEVYEVKESLSAVNIELVELNKDDEQSLADFRSPCSIYGQKEIAGTTDSNTDEENTEEEEEETDESCDGTCDEACTDDNNSDDDNTCETEQNSCHVTVTLNYHIQGTCYQNSCEAQITFTNSENTPQTTCEQTIIQDDSQALLAPYLNYCNPKQQRRYFARMKKVQKIKDQLAGIAQYCLQKDNRDGLCEGVKIHRLQKSLEQQYKVMHKIANSCKKKQVRDHAKGQYSNPEINTCRVFKRSALHASRRQLNRYENKVAHLKALCQTGKRCKSKKIARLLGKIAERKAKIERLENECHTNLKPVAVH